MNVGTGIAIGLPVGAALWLLTDNVLFLSFGLLGGILLGLIGASDEDEEDEPER